MTAGRPALVHDPDAMTIGAHVRFVWHRPSDSVAARTQPDGGESGLRGLVASDIWRNRAPSGPRRHFSSTRYLRHRWASLAIVRDGYVLTDGAGNREAARRHQDVFRFMMDGFHYDVIIGLYQLLKDSRFESAGFPLPAITPFALAAQLAAGLRNYRGAIVRVADRGPALGGPGSGVRDAG